MALELALIPAILMALAVVREKELGTITNLYVTPVTRLECPDRQATALHRACLLELRADGDHGLVHFPRAAEGKLARACDGALIYVTATTGYGMFISSFTRTQIAALFGTAILTVLPATQFSGMMVPVRR